ncbi:PIN domain nuclease [Acidobacteria bacterium AH-259-A15]|nr:PIN domain nuclease [Acidobacteria bacterium AH-259-A15]
MKNRRVLVDTSVWVNFFQGDDSTVRHLEVLMDTGEIVICGQIKQEVLQGSRSAQALARLENELSIWEYEAEQPQDFVQAARSFAELRWKGKTVPPSDCLIAAVARRCKLKLYAQDEHFNEVSDLMHYQP